MWDSLYSVAAHTHTIRLEIFCFRSPHVAFRESVFRVAGIWVAEKVYSSQLMNSLWALDFLGLLNCEKSRHRALHKLLSDGRHRMRQILRKLKCYWNMCAHDGFYAHTHSHKVIAECQSVCVHSYFWVPGVLLVCLYLKVLLTYCVSRIRLLLQFLEL